jgi:hypothetical protein
METVPALHQKYREVLHESPYPGSWVCLSAVNHPRRVRARQDCCHNTCGCVLVMGWPATIDPSRFTKEVTMFRLPTMPRFLVGAALGLLLGGQAGTALAACTQADAAGNWQVYSSSAEKASRPCGRIAP